MKIYIVTCGCYSDYHIEAVFTNRENAGKYASLWDDGQVEEYNSDSIDFSNLIFNKLQGKTCYNCYFDKEGNFVLANINKYFGPETKHLSYIFLENAEWYILKSKCNLIITVWTKNEDLAKKIACDFRRQLIAENKIK